MPKPNHTQHAYHCLTNADWLTSKHSCTGPCPFTPSIHPLRSCKDIYIVDTRLSGHIQLVRKDIGHKLAIAFGADMPMAVLVKPFLEPWGFDQTAGARSRFRKGC